MKYKTLAAVCALLLAAGMAGCGDSDSATQEPVSEEEAEAAGFSDGTEEDGTVSGETVLDTSKELTGIHHANISIEGYGDIEIELDADTAPITVTNFVKLAQEDFYDGLTFWRIMDGFMMQGGDPEGTGYGGSEHNIVGEFSSNGYDNPLSHTRGAISMARSNDPNSASSQFFIVQQDATFWDGDYAVFGYVTDGMDVVDAVCEAAQPTDGNGTIPADQQPVITSITILTDQ